MTVASESCRICSRPGALGHDGLTDRLFGTPGTWQLLRCDRDGLWWLAAHPEADADRDTYDDYYTHAPPRRSRLHLVLEALAAPGRAAHGYPARRGPLLRAAGAIVGRIAPLADIGAADVLWVDRREAGRLLDVGCGSGALAARMAGAGWQVTGLEPDERAAAIASRVYGVPVMIGTLDALRSEHDAYDVVAASHVIEHVPDPIAFIRDCWRLLRPGGELRLLTPNADSLGHRRFGADWRGLEPPRHRFLFTARSLAAVAGLAGIPNLRVRTSARAASYIWLMSDSLRRHGPAGGRLRPRFSVLRRLRARAFWLAEASQRGDRGEELVFSARK